MSKYREIAIEEHGEVCQRCGSENGVVVHHINEVRDDDSLENLIPLCSSCHAVWHRRGEWSTFEEFIESSKRDHAPDHLIEVDCDILDFLHEGRATPQYVADELELSRTYASERLKRLTEHNHVRKLASGLYELVDDPRKEQSGVGDGERPAEATEDRADLQDQAEELKAQAAALRDEKSELQMRLEGAEELDVDRIQRGIEAAITALEGQHPSIETAQAELEGVLEELDDE